VVSFASGQGKRRIAAFLPDDAFGRAADAALQAATQQHGATIVALERYPPQANGMVEPARRLGDQLREAEASGQPVDALFLPGGHEALSSVGPLLTYAGIDPRRLKVLGTGGLDHPAIGKDPLFRGAWYAGADPRGWQEFSAKFSKTFGSMPPRVAALVYDAVAAAAALAGEPAATRYSPANLTRPQGFQGIDGTVRLSSAGLAARRLAVLEVQDIGATVIDPPLDVSNQSRQLSATSGRVN
jgi:ABC-type branched-subunit amino acid transport system substrate-binding protein